MVKFCKVEDILMECLNRGDWFRFSYHGYSEIFKVRETYYLASFNCIVAERYQNGVFVRKQYFVNVRGLYVTCFVQIKKGGQDV